MPELIKEKIDKKIKEEKEKLSFTHKWKKGDAKKQAIINQTMTLLLECYSDESLLAFAEKYQGSFDYNNQNNGDDLVRRIAKFLPQSIEGRRTGEEKTMKIQEVK